MDCLEHRLSSNPKNLRVWRYRGHISDLGTLCSSVTWVEEGKKKVSKVEEWKKERGDVTFE